MALFQWAVLLSCLVSLTDGFGAEGQTSGIKVIAQPDRKNGVYQRGETIRFRIRVQRNGAEVTTGKVEYNLLVDGQRDASGAVELTAPEAVVSASLSKPGTLMIVVDYTDQGQKQSGSAGAIVDPFAIQPSLPPPADFDAFWDKQKAKLKAVPLNPRLNQVEIKQVAWGPPLECYDVELDCLGGRPVHGYYAKPINAKPRSLPAILHFHSAGITDSSMPAAMLSAKQRMLSLDINAHGLPNGQPPEFYRQLQAGELNGYWYQGIDAPETFYIYGMYLRAVRALDFLASQPEWDGKTLITSGGSQGGMQAVAAAGLDDRVTEIEADVPAFCDLTGYRANRQTAYGFRFASKQWGEAQEKTLRYYDNCHFAARTKAKASFQVGLIDTTCPASGVLAAYNQLKGEKKIVILPLRAHAGTHESQRMAKDPDYLHKQ